MRINKLAATLAATVVVALGPTATFTSWATESPASEAVEAVVEGDTAVEGEAPAVEGEESHSSESGESGVEISHAAHECIEALERGEPLENCQKAPNPILPVNSELFWGALSFAVVLVGLWKLLPMLKKAMAARSAKIEGDLAAAAKAKTDAEAEAATYTAKIGDAKAEGAALVDKARAEADTVRKDIIARAEADAAEIRRKASDDAAAQGARLKGELESHVKRLSVDLAEKVVGANLNRDTNAALVDKYISELSSN